MREVKAVGIDEKHLGRGRVVTVVPPSRNDYVRSTACVMAAMQTIIDNIEASRTGIIGRAPEARQVIIKVTPSGAPQPMRAVPVAPVEPA